MSRIFISHSSGDNAAALAVAQWLADSGWDDYFLDISPERGLAPGERWQAALKAAADRCEAVLFLISPAWQGSRWCLAEFLLAKQLGKAIFGVLIAPTPIDHLPEEMTAEWQLCDLVHGDEQRTYSVEQSPHVPRTDVRFAGAGLDRLRIGLQRAGLDPSTFPWPPANDPERSPYPGLRALDAEDAAVLFGRDAMTVRGLDQLRRMRERGIEHLFVIVGASGAGKSSFMRAGLLPRLARDDRQFLPLPVIRPERAAINGREGLLACLERAFKARGGSRSRAQLRGALEQPPGLAALLRELRDARPPVHDDAGAPPTLVIPIDQGEELFAADAGAEGAALVAHLGPLVSPDAQAAGMPHTIVLGSIRADSLDLMQSQASLQNLPTVLFNLPPVARGEFKGVIEGPAARYSAAGRKLAIDPALTEHLMADAEGADAMPLLALTLQRLYLEHGADGALTLEGYERMGGLRGSIEAAVEAAFAEPSRAPAVPEDARDRLECLRQAFVPWLASVDPDTGERKRRVARWEDIPEASRPLIDRLVAQRLLIKDRRRMRDGEQESIVVEVAHEALIRQWPPLRGWLDDEEADLRNLEGVRRAAAEWGRNESDVEWLVHTGERLDDAEALMRWPDFKAMLGTEGVAYLAACRKRDDDARAEREAQLALISRQQAQVEEEQQRTAEAQTRTARFQRWTNFALGGIAVVLAGTGWWIVKQTRDVARQTSFVVAQNSERVSDGFLATRSVPQTGRALRLAVVAAHSSPLAPAHPAAGLQVGRAAQAYRGLQVIELPADVINSAGLTPDRTRLFAMDRKAGTAQLWDLTSGAALGKVTGLEGRNRLLVSPDGERLVSWGGKASPLMWDARTGRIVARLDGHDGGVVEVRLLDRGERLITRGQADAPRLWDARDGRLIAVLEGHDASGGVSVSAGRDPTRLLTRGKDNALRLWDATDGRLVGVLDGHAGVPGWMSSPDGSRIATSRSDDSLLLWDAGTGRRIARLEAHARSRQLLFVADGSRLVSNPTGAAATLWDTANGRQIADLGETLRVYHSADGDRLATASADGGVRLWDVTDGRVVAEVHPAGGKPPHGVRISPDGKRLLLQPDEETIELYDPHDGKLIAKIRMEAPVRSAIFRRGGALLLTSAKDDQRLWDASTGKLLLAADRPNAFRFAPDDAYLVVNDEKGAPQLWSTSGRQIATLAGHTGRITYEFSRNGSRLLTIDDSESPRLWDTATGTLLATLGGHVGEVVYRQFTRDSTRVLTRGRDNEPRLWDATTGQLLAVFSGHTQDIRRMELDRDQLRVLTVSQDGTARIWDAAPPPRALFRDTHRISRIAATPDGQRLALANGRSIETLKLPGTESALSMERPLDETLFAVPGLGLVSRFGPNAVRVMDGDKGKIRSTLVGHTGRILAASMNLDRTLVGTGSADGTARIWQAEDGKLVYLLKEHRGAVEGVAFSADGKFIATRSADRVARIFDAKTGRVMAILSGHRAPITLVAIAIKAPRVVTASEDRTARVWDATSGRPIAVLAPHPGPVRSAFLSPDGLRAVTVAGGATLVWDVESGRKLLEIGGQEGGALFANLDGSGKHVITLGIDSGLRVWEVDTGKEIAHFPGSGQPFRAGLDEKAERAVELSKDGWLKVWDIAKGTLTETRRLALTVTALALDPSGRHVLVGWSDGMVELRDTGTGETVLSYTEHDQPVTAVALSPDGSRAATGAEGGALKIWDAKDGKTLHAVAGRVGAVSALAFSPDGALLAVAGSSGTEARLLDVQTGREIGTLTGHASAIASIAFGTGGERLVTASKDRTARVWNVKTRQVETVIEGIDPEVRAATLDARGTRLVTASADRSSRVWDVATGELLAELDDHGSQAGFAAFMSDGAKVMTVSQGGIVRAWDVAWVARARDAALVAAVCKEKLVGASSILTAADVRDAPLLTGRVGEDVCAGYR